LISSDDNIVALFPLFYLGLNFLFIYNVKRELFDLLYRDIIDTSLFAKLLKNSVIPIPSFIRKNNCPGNGILGS
jgi:hypothetical protein